MNFLPFVFIMMSCLALLAQSMFSQFRLSQIERKECDRYFYALHDALNRTAKEIFEENRPTSSKPKKSHQPSNKKPKRFARDHAYANGYSFLNLYAILEDPSRKQFVTKTAQLFQFLYRDLASEDILNEIFERLLIQLKEHPQKLTKKLLLSSFLDSQIALEQKMIYGTKAFYLDERKGYPAIDDVFQWNPEDRSFGYFRHLSPTVLSLFLGKQLTKDILEKEKQLTSAHPKNKPQTLSQKKLSELIDADTPPILELLSFKDKKPRSSMVGFDESNHPVLLIPPHS